MQFEELTQLSTHIYVSPPENRTDRPIMGAVMGSESTLIIEPGASYKHTAEFLTALKKLNPPTPRYAAVTHWHWDHSFGIAEMNLPTIAHRLTHQKINEMAKLDWRDAALNKRVDDGKEIAFIADHLKIELSNQERTRLKIKTPDILFDKQLSIDLGDLTCEIIHVGGDHSADSSVIYIPEDSVVFLGDCIYGGFDGDDIFYTLEQFIPLSENLLSLKADKYILAHQEEPITAERFTDIMHKLRTTGEVVRDTEGNKETALKELKRKLGKLFEDDDVEYIDNFIFGLNNHTL